MGKPTPKMINALRAFKIPEAEIGTMSFEQASERLSKLIADANARKGGKTATGYSGISPNAVPTGLSNAGRKEGAGAVQANPHLSLALPPLPRPLSLQELEALYNDMVDKYPPDMAATMLRGRLDIIEQEFSIALNRRISAQKAEDQRIAQANIAAVKGGRA